MGFGVGPMTMIMGIVSSASIFIYASLVWEQIKVGFLIDEMLCVRSFSKQLLVWNDINFGELVSKEIFTRVILVNI